MNRVDTSSASLNPGGHSHHRAIILAIILVSYVMIVLDTSIVITGLPKIHRELGFTDTGLSWVTNAYTLTFGGFLLLGARAGDIFGRRRVYIAGLTLFAISSLAIGLARSPAELVIARCIQGIGSAILAPSTLALLQATFPAGPERSRAVSYYASAAGISASIGLVLGGVLAEWLSWRVGFFVNLPICAGLALAAGRYVAETERRSGQFDLLGAFTSTLGMSALVFGTVNSATSGWVDRLTLGALGLGGITLALFVVTQWRARQPIMPLRLFASRERSSAYLARALFNGANMGFFFFSTQFMQGVLGLGASLTGLAFVPAMLVNFLMALAAPRLIRQIGGRYALSLGLFVNLIGLAALALVTTASTYLGSLALPMLLVGLGLGGSLGPLTTFGIAGVAAEDAGAASGLVNAAHQLGGSLGLGFLVAISAFGTGSLSGEALLTHQVVVAMGTAAAMLGLALLFTFTLMPKVARV